MSDSVALLEVRGLSVALEGSPVLFDVDLTVSPRELLALMGPNGSGKTTLLRALVGLERPSAGAVFLEGEEITRWPPHRRHIGLLMQEPALFPRRTVLENVAYGPLVQGRSVPEARQEALHALKEVRLEGFGPRPAHALSGGERQRVALARAIAARPKLILLDEPFAAIDPEVRGELRGEFRRILAGRGIGAIHVTHDREEGLFLGDRVAVLIDGRLRRVGEPRTVLANPHSQRVARFLGYNVANVNGRSCAFLPRETGLAPPGAGDLLATLIASGYNGREWVLVARTEEGERVEVLSEERGDWPAAGAPLGLRVPRSVPLTEP